MLECVFCCVVCKPQEGAKPVPGSLLSFLPHYHIGRLIYDFLKMHYRLTLCGKMRKWLLQTVLWNKIPNPTLISKTIENLFKELSLQIISKGNVLNLVLVCCHCLIFLLLGFGEEQLSTPANTDNPLVKSFHNSSFQVTADRIWHSAPVLQFFMFI